MQLGGKPHYRTTRPTLSFIDTRVMLEVMPGSRGVGGVVGGEGRGGLWGRWVVVLCWFEWPGSDSPAQVALHESARSRRSTGAARPTVA